MVSRHYYKMLATIVGYALQGSLKYGLYEFLKPTSFNTSFGLTIFEFLIL